MRGHPVQVHAQFPYVKLCKVDGIVYKLINGMWILNDDPASYYAHLPLYGGVPGYHRAAIEACLEVCPINRRTVIDGGAHIGLVALQLHQYFPNLYAFEPLSHNYVCLRENFYEHANLKKYHPEATTAITALYPEALSNKDGTLHLVQKGLKSWSWHAKKEVVIEEGAEVVEKEISTAVEVEVRCRTIDTMELEGVDLIKLDVEGHEYEILEGAVETIKRDRPSILIEEKFDTERKASALLVDLGMVKVWVEQYDCLFTWPEHVKTRKKSGKNSGWLATS